MWGDGGAGGNGGEPTGSDAVGGNGGNGGTGSLVFGRGGNGGDGGYVGYTPPTNDTFDGPPSYLYWPAGEAGEAGTARTLFLIPNNGAPGTGNAAPTYTSQFVKAFQDAIQGSEFKLDPTTGSLPHPYYEQQPGLGAVCNWCEGETDSDTWQLFARGQVLKLSLSLAVYDAYKAAQEQAQKFPDNPDKLMTYRYLNYMIGNASTWEWGILTADESNWREKPEGDVPWSLPEPQGPKVPYNQGNNGLIQSYWTNPNGTPKEVPEPKPELWRTAKVVDPTVANGFGAASSALGDLGISLLSAALAGTPQLAYNWGVTQESLIQTLLEGSQSAWFYNSNLDPRLPFSWSGPIKVGNPAATGVPLGDVVIPGPDGVSKQNFLPQMVWLDLPLDLLSYDGSDSLVEQFGEYYMTQFETQFLKANQDMLHLALQTIGDSKVFGIPGTLLYPILKALGPVLSNPPNPVSPTNSVMATATTLAIDTNTALENFSAFISTCGPGCTITDTPGLAPDIGDFYDSFLNPWIKAG